MATPALHNLTKTPMRQTPERRQQVLDAANQLIVEGGLAGFSMLALARTLSMSKETLYAWFGSKSALLAELVQGNAGGMAQVLLDGLAEPPDAAALRGTLERFCRALLTLLSSDKSVAINRGAVHLAEKGEMDQTLRTNGRDAMVALLARYFAHARAAGLLVDAGRNEADVLIALALRDWQIERLLGRMGPPGARKVQQRAVEAVDLFLRLYAAPPTGA
jgi:TetR/AcrR family transcriptional repressor of mexJK operon